MIEHGVALIDLRATHGGMSLGMVLILFLLSTSPQGVRIGLLVVPALMVGMVEARTLGMLVESAANAVMLLYLTLDLTAGAVEALLLYKGGQSGAFP